MCLEKKRNLLFSFFSKSKFVGFGPKVMGHEKSSTGWSVREEIRENVVGERKKKFLEVKTLTTVHKITHYVPQCAWSLCEIGHFSKFWKCADGFHATQELNSEKWCDVIALAEISETLQMTSHQIRSSHSLKHPIAGIKAFWTSSRICPGFPFH